MPNHVHQLTLAAAKEFIFGGKAVLTLLNTATRKRATYRIQQPKDKLDSNDSVFWVKAFTGSDNNTQYSYIGCIWDKEKFVYSWKKAKLEKDTPEVRGFEFLMNAINTQKLDPKFEIWHEGKCCRCGRRLTVPDSIASGIGPECARIKESHFEGEYND